MSTRFYRNAGVLAIGEVLSRLKGLIIMPLLTRHFGALRFGAWAQVGVLITTITPLIVLGTDSGLLRHLPGRDEETQRSEFFGWLTALLGCAAVVCVAVTLARGPVAAAFFGGGRKYEDLIPLAAGTLFADLLIVATRSWFRIRNHAVMFTVVTVVQAMSGIAVVWLVLVRHESVYQLVFYGFLTDAALATVLLLRVVLREGWSPPDFSIVPSLLRFGIPLVPAGFAIWGLNSMDRLFLVHYTSLSEVGVYSFAYSLGYIAVQVMVNPVWTMYPSAVAERFNLGDMAGVQSLFDRSLTVILFLAVPSIVGLALLGRQVIVILSGPEFAAGGPLIAVVAAGYLCNMLAGYYETALGLAFRQVLSTVTITIACLVNLGLNVVLIPRYGIAGAAVATAAAFATQLAANLVLAHRLTPVRTPLRAPVRVAAASVVMAVAVSLLRIVLTTRRISFTLALIGTGVTVYVAAAYAVGLVSPEVRRLVFSVLPGREAREASPAPAEVGSSAFSLTDSALGGPAVPDEEK